MAKRLLITGAEGQLGKAIQFQFAENFELLATARNPSSAAKKKRNVISLDIANRSTVNSILGEFKPHIIINCAAYTNVDGCEIQKDKAHDVNVNGLQNLIQFSEKDACIVQISSDYVFNGKDGPYAETDHTFPVNYYGKTKLEAENLLRGAQRKHLIFRGNVLFSEDLFCKSNFFAWVYTSLLKNKPIAVVDDQVSNPTLISEFVKAIFQAMVMKCEGVFHVGSEDFLSRYEFALNIAKNFKMDTSLISPVSTAQLAKNIPNYVAERPKHSGLKTTKIEKNANLTVQSTEYNLKRLKRLL
ncbi:MAG: SDR family oxidoreductase [Candidatus Marinimicrobia bacterium]|nr:SDR family oxidoreductase [Candidatus Neomarinimicrobiota bacterium]